MNGVDKAAVSGRVGRVSVGGWGGQGIRLGGFDALSKGVSGTELDRDVVGRQRKKGGQRRAGLEKGVRSRIQPARTKKSVDLYLGVERG